MKEVQQDFHRLQQMTDRARQKKNRDKKKKKKKRRQTYKTKGTTKRERMYTQKLKDGSTRFLIISVPRFARR